MHGVLTPLGGEEIHSNSVCCALESSNITKKERRQRKKKFPPFVKYNMQQYKIKEQSLNFKNNKHISVQIIFCSHYWKKYASTTMYNLYIDD